MQDLMLNIQTCYANDVLNLEFFSSIIQSEKTEEEMKSFVNFKKLNIKPFKDGLLFTGELENIYKNSSKEIKDHLKKVNAKNLFKKALEQQMVERFNFDLKKEELEEMIEADLEEEITNKISIYDCKNAIVRNIWDFLICIGLTPELYLEDDSYLIAANCTSIDLNQFDLFNLYNLSTSADFFAILSQYNEEDEEDEDSIGLRFCWEIKK